MDALINLPFDYNKLKNRIFELYIKTPNREFKSHVRFIEADSLEDAENYIADIDSTYWQSMSIRPVSLERLWETFESLHVSYHLCKSILRLDDLPTP